MALASQPGNDRKRVKVYELKNGDWFDRGTGFCTGSIVNDEARIYVQSEDEPVRPLLETRINKDDGYQKQQDTLIVWTESNGTDMALSFQEAEGCGAIWDFVSEVQSRLTALSGADDGLSDDVMDNMHPIMLPAPELGNLPDIENMMRGANNSPQGRDALAKFIVGADYIAKLVPLVEMAEDLESLEDLHRLCNIMKTLILLNDTAIIEYVVADEVIIGVVGALEYDPDFPSHKANHRQYLADPSRFKEVVKIDSPDVKRKIHFTYRLQYLRDVVLARILDDPTFSVLNSLIFFHQVDIVQHIQANGAFLKELFGLVGSPEAEGHQKKDAVLFIQQCCQIAKNLQANARAQLYQNFIHHGLFPVLTFALKHPSAAVRVAGTDILVALIDHDAVMMRSQIFKAINEKSKPLTDTLIELLLIESDLGVKAQMADAIKVLLDPNANSATMETLGRANSDFLAKRNAPISIPQTESFIQNFYDESAKKLFRPLKDLEGRECMHNLTIQEVSLYSYLVDVLCFFIRQHSFRSKYFILSESLASRIAQLMDCPEKHLKLCALKYFRTCIGLHDEFHNRQIITNRLFDPILRIVEETMPRDNLLNSACLELFEFIKRENIKTLITHLFENYREKLHQITYVPTFQHIILRYEQMHEPPVPTAESSFASQDNDAPVRHQINGGQRWQGLKDTDAEEEAYFNGSDDEDEAQATNANAAANKAAQNGASPAKPLVDYPDEDDDETMDILEELCPNTKTALAPQPSPDGSAAAAPPQSPQSESSIEPAPATSNTSPTASPTTTSAPSQAVSTAAPTSSKSPSHSPSPPTTPTPSALQTPPPERLSEKRRREEDEEDELGKLSTQSKRRSSSASSVVEGKEKEREGRESGAVVGSTDCAGGRERDGREGGALGLERVERQGQGQGHGHLLRRKRSINSGKDGGPKRISISLAVKSGGGGGGNGGGNGNGNGKDGGGGGGE